MIKQFFIILALFSNISLTILKDLYKPNMSTQRPYQENAKCEVSNEILSSGWLSNRSKLPETIVGVLGQWPLVNIITGKPSRTLQKPKLTEAS